MKLTSKQYVSLIGAIMVVVGSFLDWLTADSIFGSIGVKGIDGDGKFTAAAGGLVILSLLIGSMKQAAVASVVLLGIAGVIGFADYLDVQDRIESIDAEAIRASVGTGLWLVLAGAIVGVIGGILTLTGEKVAGEPAPLPGPPGPLA